MSTSKVILCTGANRGLGYSILESSGEREPHAIYILACRSISSGHEAIAKLRETGIQAEIRALQLDVTDDDQITAAVKYVGSNFGKLDVLINNAGILGKAQGESLSDLRSTYNEVLNINLTSVAILTTAFMPLLHNSADPKVINVTSGLGSITNTLTRKMGRYPTYGSSKIGMNGATVHMQTAENDRIAALAEKSEEIKETRVRLYVVQPGVLSTAFTRYSPRGKDPKEGAEVVVRLLLDEEGTYPGGTYWEFENGEMKQVPW